MPGRVPGIWEGDPGMTGCCGGAPIFVFGCCGRPIGAGTGGVTAGEGAPCGTVGVAGGV